MMLKVNGAGADGRTEGTQRLRRAMGFGDVVLFFITAGVNLQWVATAAAAGPVAVTFWVVALFTMTIPLGLSVIELSSRYPQEGGVYLWCKQAFGDFSGFIAGWSYWTSNLPYFPGVLYFAAANALFAFGDAGRALSDSVPYFLGASVVGLAFATVLNLVGLNVGKQLNNAGAVARWLAALGLVAMGVLAYTHSGSATEFTEETLIPRGGLKDLLFLSTIVFALTGLEAASFMGDEIREPRKTIPRAIYIAGPLVPLIYLVGTVSVLVALPAEEVSSMQAIMEAMSSAGERLGIPGVAPVAAILIAVSALGSVGAWLGATARIPFVAGIDRYLPKSFGNVHPKWRTPHVALLTEAGIAVLCVLAAQAGSTVRSAYDILVSMTIITFLIPFLFLYLSLIVLQREPAGPEVRRVPGGKPVAILVGSVGFAVTLVATVFSFLPPADEPNKVFYSVKLFVLTTLLLGVGAGLYGVGRRRQSAAGRSATS
jgi:amino acid transporter